MTTERIPFIGRLVAATATSSIDDSLLGQRVTNADASIPGTLDLTITERDGTVRTVTFVGGGGGGNGGGGLNIAQVRAAVASMVTGNTETGVIVTYQTTDNTLDFVIGTGAITNDMLAADSVDRDKIADRSIESQHIADAAVDDDRMLGTNFIPPAALETALRNTINMSAFTKSGTAPSTPSDDDLWLDTANDEWKIYDTSSTSWVTIGGGSTAGLTVVATDATITGNGTSSMPLSLATNAVTTPKIQNGAVTTNKVQDGAITHPKLGANAVENENISDGEIAIGKMNAAAQTQINRFSSSDETKLDGIEANAKDDQNASEVATSTTNFGNNLTTSADTVQKALDEIDNLTIGSGGGGLSTTQVRNLIADWAEQGNTTNIPAGKLANQRFTTDDETKLDAITDTGSGQIITATERTKLDGVETGANVGIKEVVSDEQTIFGDGVNSDLTVSASLRTLQEDFHMGGWQDSTDIQVGNKTSATAYDSSNIGTGTFSLSYTPGTLRQTNVYVAIGVPNDDPVINVNQIASGQIRLVAEGDVSGREDILVAQDISGVQLNTGITLTYFNVLMPDIPVGATLKVQERTKTVLDIDTTQGDTLETKLDKYPNPNVSNVDKYIQVNAAGNFAFVDAPSGGDGNGDGGASTSVNLSELIYDYSPATQVPSVNYRINERALRELPNDFSPALAEEDDDDILFIRFGFQNDTSSFPASIQSNRRYLTLTIRAGDFRTAPINTTGNTANVGQIDGRFAYMIPESNNGGGNWHKGYLFRGPNGRPALMSGQANVVLNLFQVYKISSRFNVTVPASTGDVYEDITAIPASPTLYQKFNLTEPQTYAGHYVLSPGLTASDTFLGYLDGMPDVGSLEDIAGNDIIPANSHIASIGYYTATYATTTIRNSVQVIRQGATKTPNMLFINGVGYALTATGGGLGQHYFTAAGVPSPATLFATGSLLFVNVGFTDGTFSAPSRMLQPGEYEQTRRGLIQAPGRHNRSQIESWFDTAAQAGSTEYYPAAKRYVVDTVANVNALSADAMEENLLYLGY